MNITIEKVQDFELGISPYIKRKNNNYTYDLITATNSLGKVFRFVTEVGWIDNHREKLVHDIEQLKYPLEEMEQKTLLSHILVVAAAKRKRALTYDTLDNLLKSLGVYFRLGVLHLDFLERKKLILNLCTIYQLRVVANRFSLEDIEAICGLSAQGISITELLKLYPDRDYQDIYRLLKKNGILIRQRNIKAWTDEDVSLLKTLREQGVSYNEISEKHLVGRSPASIRAYASMIGITK